MQTDPAKATGKPLVVEGVNVFYDKQQVLRDLAFDVRAGERVAILGRNGAGKSTTAKALTGLVRIMSGRVSCGSEDLTNRPTHEIVAAGISHVPEGRRVFAQLTVRDNLLVGAYINHRRANELMERAIHHFPVLGERLNAHGGQLSGGQQQMLAIARALMSSPKLLILDEPTMGLAPIIVEQLAHSLIELNQEEGITILLIDQRLSLVELVAERAYVLREGMMARSIAAHELAQMDLDSLYVSSIAAGVS
jgi:branched-chain amino acid transport system ATP-binding protein